jgi:O-antigen ligase
LPSHETAGSHFLSIGSNRYDFWRVALHEFAAHPLAGVGERGFQAVYLERRRSAETPARSHSVEMDFLSETGIVGFALWLGAVGSFLAAAGRGSRRLDAGATAALGTGVYFLVHSSVDWTWSFPAVALSAFLLLGAATARERFAPVRTRVALPLAFAAFVFAALALAPPWLASRLTSAGTSNASSSDLRLAKRLDPLAVEPYLGEAAIASTPAKAIRPLRQAVGKQPRSVGLRYQLAIAELRAGRRADAKRDLLAARRLDPGDFLISQALARLRHRR